jgi:hypothetical protein
MAQNFIACDREQELLFAAELAGVVAWTMAVVSIGRKKRREIHLLRRVHNKPCEMLLERRMIRR